MNKGTGIFNYLKNYVDKNKSNEKSIEEGHMLESPAMIGYFEAKEILSLLDTIDKARELVNKQLLSNSNYTGYTDEMCLKDLLSILGDKDE